MYENSSLLTSCPLPNQWLRNYTSLMIPFKKKETERYVCIHTNIILCGHAGITFRFPSMPAKKIIFSLEVRNSTTVSTKYLWDMCQGRGQPMMAHTPDPALYPFLLIKFYWKMATLTIHILSVAVVTPQEQVHYLQRRPCGWRSGKYLLWALHRKTLPIPELGNGRKQGAFIFHLPEFILLGSF